MTRSRTLALAALAAASLSATEVHARASMPYAFFEDTPFGEWTDGRTRLVIGREGWAVKDGEPCPVLDLLDGGDYAGVRSSCFEALVSGDTMSVRGPMDPAPRVLRREGTSLPR